MTKTGPDPDKECIFPFIFSETDPSQERTYNACALDYIGRPWCPTKLDGNGRFFIGYDENADWIGGDWGYCGYDCLLTNLPAGDIQSLLDYHVEIRNILAIDCCIYYW